MNALDLSKLTPEHINLLIIEDNPGDTRLILEYLKFDSQVKYEVKSSATLKDGLKLLSSEPVDIVLTDLGLPDSQGISTCTEILKRYPDVPLIIMTGLDDEKLGLESIRLGVQTFLIKNNITPNALSHSIKFSLERKRIIKELTKSKEENVAIVKAIPDLLFGLNNKGIFQKCYSPKIYELYPSVEDYFGRNIDSFLPVHLSSQIMDAIKLALKEKELITFESELLYNEVNRYFEFRVVPLAEGDLLMLVRDISKRKQAEESLVRSEAMFRKLLQTSPEAIIRMDPESNILAFSDVTPAMLGYKKNMDLRNLPFIQFISEEDKKKLKELFVSVMTEGIVPATEMIMYKHDRSTFLGEVSLAITEDIDGRHSGYIAILRDITSKKIMEMQMIHNARMLSLGEMAAGIAHEINQPLNIISITLENMMVEVMQDKAVDKNYVKTKSEKIFDNISRMRNIIDHIRSFSRERDDLIHGMFDIHDGINNAVSMISAQFKHHGIELVLNFDRNIQPYPGDIYKFEQVILNLLSNARDAIEERVKETKTSLAKSVKITTYLDSKSVIVEVIDNGIGIKSTDLDKVMMPFYTTKETGKGTGLGLSISYGIIKEMNGSIVIFSKRNLGTTIKIMLPVQSSFKKDHQETN